jgi:hypothetical protein
MGEAKCVIVEVNIMEVDASGVTIAQNSARAQMRWSEVAAARDIHAILGDIGQFALQRLRDGDPEKGRGRRRQPTPPATPAPLPADASVRLGEEQGDGNGNGPAPGSPEADSAAMTYRQDGDEAGHRDGPPGIDPKTGDVGE